jgi:hypothetical protein
MSLQKFDIWKEMNQVPAPNAMPVQPQQQPPQDEEEKNFFTGVAKQVIDRLGIFLKSKNLRLTPQKASEFLKELNKMVLDSAKVDHLGAGRAADIAKQIR